MSAPLWPWQRRRRRRPSRLRCLPLFVLLVMMLALRHAQPFLLPLSRPSPPSLSSSHRLRRTALAAAAKAPAATSTMMSSAQAVLLAEKLMCLDEPTDLSPLGQIRDFYFPIYDRYPDLYRLYRPLNSSVPPLPPPFWVAPSAAPHLAAEAYRSSQPADVIDRNERLFAERRFMHAQMDVTYPPGLDDSFVRLVVLGYIETFVPRELFLKHFQRTLMPQILQKIKTLPGGTVSDLINFIVHKWLFLYPAVFSALDTFPYPYPDMARACAAEYSFSVFDSAPARLIVVAVAEVGDEEKKQEKEKKTEAAVQGQGRRRRMYWEDLGPQPVPELRQLRRLWRRRGQAKRASSQAQDPTLRLAQLKAAESIRFELDGEPMVLPNRRDEGFFVVL